MKKVLDKYTQCVYNIYVRLREASLSYKKGSEEMTEMTASQTERLIDWLRAKGLTDTEIVECFKYINEKG